jgi:putative ABC transport system permease protein
MFFRLLLESFVRQRRRKALAGIAILLGTTAVTAMLALATTIGDRIHAELAVYGANIVVTPQATNLDVKIGGADIHPVIGNAYLHESDLAKLRTIFWANNITGVSPELSFPGKVEGLLEKPFLPAQIAGYRFATNPSSPGVAPLLHPWWKLNGRWPQGGMSDASEVVLGTKLATSLNASVGSQIYLKENDGHYTPFALDHSVRPRVLIITGIVSTGDAMDTAALMDIADVQDFLNLPDAVSRVEISARTKPEDAFARKDPDTLSPAQHEIWYCRPYANSIAYQIQEAIPGARAEQVRKVEQSEGTVLARISGLMWLISAAALLAAGFAVSAAMATAILERRAEIGLMRSLGAAKSSIALLFYAETSILALIAGTLGYLLGCTLAAWLGSRIFAGDVPAATTHLAAIAAIFIPVLLPVTVGLALLVAIAGSTPSIRAALQLDPANILRADA